MYSAGRRIKLVSSDCVVVTGGSDVGWVVAVGDGGAVAWWSSRCAVATLRGTARRGLSEAGFGVRRLIGRVKGRALGRSSSLRVVSLNLRYPGVARTDRLGAYLRDLTADVLLLQEANGRWVERLCQSAGMAWWRSSLESEPVNS